MRSRDPLRPLVITKFMRIAHVYSAMPVLLLMVFFAITGFYLNHPELEPGSVSRQQQTLTLPAWALTATDQNPTDATQVMRLLQWLDAEHDVRGVDFAVEHDDLDDLLIINLSGPNGTALVEVSYEEGVAYVDRRALSFLATLNNLHRAKHVTGFWRYLSDLSALCMLIFCVSGCWLIAVNKLERGSATVAMVIGSGLFLWVIVVMH